MTYGNLIKNRIQYAFVGLLDTLSILANFDISDIDLWMLSNLFPKFEIKLEPIPR